MFVVRRTAVDYSALARLDDMISVVSRIEQLGRASVDFHQEEWRGDVLLATGNVRVASVNRVTIRPAAVPDCVLDGLRCGPHAACGTAQAPASHEASTN